MRRAAARRQRRRIRAAAGASSLEAADRALALPGWEQSCSGSRFGCAAGGRSTHRRAEARVLRAAIARRRARLDRNAGTPPERTIVASVPSCTEEAIRRSERYEL